MSRTTVTSIALICVVALVGWNRYAASGYQQPDESVPLQQVQLDHRHISPDGKWLLGFVPTGSADQRVLGSINEHWMPGDRVDYIACSAENSPKLGPGVAIVAQLDSGRAFAQEASLHVTVFQPGAKFGDLLTFADAGIPQP